MITISVTFKYLRNFVPVTTLSVSFEYLCLLCNVIIFYCDELSNRIGHKLLEIRGKQKTHELIQTGGKRRKIRRKQNITKL